MGSNASAATYQAPNPDFFNPDGSDVLLVASDGGSSNGLNSPTIIVMAYFNNPTGNTIVIGNGKDECGIPGTGTGPDGTGPAYTTFTFIDRGANSAVNSMSRNSSQLSCGDDTIAVPTLQPYTIPGTNTQKYVLKITAFNSTNSSINAFRISMLPGQGVMSYYDQSTRQFAIQDRQSWGPYPGNETTMNLPFGPSCTYKKGVSPPVVLRWYDDDWGVPGGNQSANMRMELLQDGVVVATNPTSDFTGPDTSGDWDITQYIQPGKKYIWRWSGVSERNGIQFQLPFDSFYYNFECNARPTVAFDIVCDKQNDTYRINYWVGDADGDKYDIRAIWDGDDNEADLLAQGRSPSTGYNFDVRNRRDFASHAVRLRIVSDGGQTIEYPDIPEKTAPACAEAECSPSVELTPASPQANETFRLRATMSANIGSKGQGTLYNAQIVLAGSPTVTAIKGSPGTYTTSGDTLGGAIGNEPASGGTTEYMEWDIKIPAAGKYGGWVAVTGGFNVTCHFGQDDTIRVSNQPYLRAWRGDVTAGCDGTTAGWPRAAGSAGRILAFNSGKGTGSGGDLAVQALNRINGFSSRQAAGMGVDDYLTFANTGSGVNATWGGSLGRGVCPSDYFGGAPTPSATNGNKTAISGSLGSLTSSGDYIFSGGTITGGTIGPNTHLNVYVDGDLTITGNILLNTGASWSSVSEIPSLRLIVRGNIYIDHGVSKLEGIYVAQPGSAADVATTGIIYTCTNGSALYDQVGLINNCSGADDNSLSVYGSFIARYVKLLRLKWSTNSANPADTISGATGVPSGSAAEKFIYTPETWLSAPSQASTSGTYDAITSLPPVF